MNKSVIKLGLCLMVIVTTFAVSGNANADILITPSQVVFQDRDRFGSVILVNTGDEVRTYDVEWMFFKMIDGAAGNYEVVDSPPGEFDLSKYIIFSPRRVTLAPGASQKIKLALRRPSKIPEGDYHAHLKFALDPRAPEDVVERQKKDIETVEGSSGAAVSINVSYSIPVVLVSGKPEVDVDIKNLSLKRNENNGRLQASFAVERSGRPYSVLGHLYIFHIDDKGREEMIGEVGNAFVFSEVSSRLFDVVLSKEISSGSLRIVLKSYDKESDLVYVDKTFPLK